MHICVYLNKQIHAYIYIYIYIYKYAPVCFNMREASCPKFVVKRIAGRKSRTLEISLTQNCCLKAESRLHHVRKTGRFGIGTYVQTDVVECN